MSNGDLNWITNFIWPIADDVLRDLYVRGKYRDVILPMTVLRRLDAVLEPSKQPVLDMKVSLDRAGIVHHHALRQAAGQAFYNTSRFTLRELRARTSQQQLKVDFEAYLDGFSPNVQDILDSFEFRNQIPKLSRSDALGTLIEKFLDSSVAWLLLRQGAQKNRPSASLTRLLTGSELMHQSDHPVLRGGGYVRAFFGALPHLHQRCPWPVGALAC
jgi:type I restriction-modification system DNA methylase subunit